MEEERTFHMKGEKVCSKLKMENCKYLNMAGMCMCWGCGERGGENAYENSKVAKDKERGRTSWARGLLLICSSVI